MLRPLTAAREAAARETAWALAQSLAEARRIRKIVNSFAQNP